MKRGQAHVSGAPRIKRASAARIARPAGSGAAGVVGAARAHHRRGRAFRQHRNLHPGTSVEFTEHKEYAPGDEIRRIDWKAVGRTDRYYVKRFEDETEMRTFLVLDTSAVHGLSPREAFPSWTTLAICARRWPIWWASSGTRPVCWPSPTKPSLAFHPPRGRGKSARCSRRWKTEASRRRPGWRCPRYLGGDLRQAQPSRRVVRPARQRGWGSRPDRDRTIGGTPAPVARARARRGSVPRARIPTRSELPFEDLMFFEGMEPGDRRTLLADSR